MEVRFIQFSFIWFFMYRSQFSFIHAYAFLSIQFDSIYRLWVLFSFISVSISLV